jgi:hypothetical protein
MPAEMFETEINKAPALRISHIVRDPINVDGRVRYLVDPDGLGDERAIPEDVVLIRWRRRKMDGHTFHGCRLGPSGGNEQHVARSAFAHSYCARGARGDAITTVGDFVARGWYRR